MKKLFSTSPVKSRKVGLFHWGRSPLFITLLLTGFVGVAGAAYLVVTSGGQTISTSSLNKGLIAHYPLSSESMKSSTVFADTTMHGYDGTITTGSSEGFVTDQHGNTNGAYDFNGDTVISTTLTSNEDFLNGFSISAWIRPSSFVNYGHILSKQDSNYGTNGFALVISPSSELLRIYVNNLSPVSSYSNTIDLDWQHITMTINADSLVSFYINGIIRNSPSSTEALENITTASALKIGQSFYGDISDVRIYNRVLSVDEVSLLYNSYKPRVHVDCAGVIDSDGQWYDAIKIGTQCWMKENMNAGTKIDDPGSAAITAACTGNSGTEQTIGGLTCYCTSETTASCQRNGAGGVTQKYCYSNTESYCTSDGALYEWQEAMDLAANCAYTDCSGSINTPHQGICPDGWHIPTDTEWKTLEGYLGMSTAQQDTTSWRGTNEGDKLKIASDCDGGVDCNSSGFSDILAGTRNSSGVFENRGSGENIWASSQDSSTNAWRRTLGLGVATVYRNTATKLAGNTLRCLKD